MPLIAFGKTDIGRKRQTNQDAILIDTKHHLYLVADGMGGHKGGDIASQTAVKLISNFVANNSHLEAPQLLTQAIQYANQAIYEQGQRQAELKGMGTTVVAALLVKNQLTLANVGDSRAYLLHDHELFQMTKDHTLIQEKISLGIYSREDAPKDKMKNVLIKTVGFEPQVEVDIFQYKMLQGDILLLCSDGLHGRLADPDILSILDQEIPNPLSTSSQNLQLGTQSLIDQSNQRGGQDNISAILALAQ